MWQAESKRQKVIAKSSSKGHQSVLEAFGTTSEECNDAELLRLLKEAHFNEDDLDMQKMDMTAKKVTFEVQDAVAVWVPCIVLCRQGKQALEIVLEFFILWV